MHVHDEDIPPPLVKSSPPPPSILRELFNDIAANVTDAVDHQGRATAKGLVALVEEISIISGTPSEKLPKPSQVDEVMTHLDVNKNGTIEFGEFLHWVALQCKLSTNDRNKLRKKSDIHDRLQMFVLSLRKACKILLTEKRNIEMKLLPLEKGLNQMFEAYDQDRSGFLDVTEIAKMLYDTTIKTTQNGQTVDYENDGVDHSNDAQEILYALDADRNGYVEQSEFVKWVLSGLTRPKRSREIFASYSTFHQRMENMLQGIERVALQGVDGFVDNDGVEEKEAQKEAQSRETSMSVDSLDGTGDPSLFR